MYTGVVLALDLATTTGWAYGRPGDNPTFGTIRFSKPGTARALTYRRFRDWIEQMAEISGADVLVYESPAVPSIMAGRTNINTIKFLIGLAEHLEEWAYDQIELREARVADVRVHFIGHNMKSALAKAETIAQCKRLGWNVATSDEGDAVALWDYQCACLRPDIAARQTPLFKR